MSLRKKPKKEPKGYRPKDDKPKPVSEKTMRGRLDRLAGKVCRARGYCEAAAWDDKTWPCNGGLQWCHIVGRNAKKIRHDPKNCVCMCGGCHKRMGDNPLMFARFIEWIDPEREVYLIEKEREFKNWKLVQVYEYWERIYKEAA